MSKIALSPNASGTGTLTIAAPNTNSDRTLTLPDTSAPILAGSGITLSASAPANTLVTDASGNVGIGTSSPAQPLEVAGVSSTKILLNRNDGANDCNIAFKTNTASPVLLAGGGPSEILRVFTGGSERMRIDSSGNLLVGTTSSGGNGITAQPVGTFIVRNNAAAAGHVFQSFRRSTTEIGFIDQVGTTSVRYSTTSDYRLKENVQPMTGAMEKVAALKPCTYSWKSTGEADEGFIAHELQAVCPQAVSGHKDAVETYTDEDGVEQTRPKYQGIDTSFLVATLTAAIQELKAQVDAQAAEIAALKGQA